MILKFLLFFSELANNGALPDWEKKNLLKNERLEKSTKCSTTRTGQGKTCSEFEFSETWIRSASFSPSSNPFLIESQSALSFIFISLMSGSLLPLNFLSDVFLDQILLAKEINRKRIFWFCFGNSKDERNNLRIKSRQLDKIGRFGELRWIGVM